MPFEFSGLTDIGCQRKENEDRILIEPALGLFAVCDGMGGHTNGGTAAELAIAAIRYYLDASSDRLDVTWPFGYDFKMSIDANRIATGIRMANRQVWRRAEEEIECAGMGTTVAAALLNSSNAVIANVGDSRAYRFRSGSLAQLTVDDTVVRDMYEQSLIDARQMRDHPMRNVLTQAAGSKADVDVHIREEELQSDDVLLLSSDGLHGVLPEETVASIIAGGHSLEHRVRQLVDAVRSLGAPDNISVVLVHYRI
jgi:protein phosphatase